MSHLTHLRTFLEVYRLRSMSKAAVRLGMTPPAASQHIQSLEALTGKPLFVRQARGVAATEAADELARSIAPHIDGLEMKLATLRPGGVNGGTVHIVGPSDFIHYCLAPRLAPLIQDGFSLRFHTGEKRRIYDLLDNEAVDLAVTASVPDPHRYHYARLLSEKLLLVYAPSLMRHLETLTQETLSRTPLLAFDEDLPLVRALWLSLFNTAPDLKAALTVPDMRILKTLALNGHGWTVLPDYHCHTELAEGHLIAPQAHPPVNELYLVWGKRRTLTPAAQHIKDVVLTGPV